MLLYVSACACIACASSAFQHLLIMCAQSQAQHACMYLHFSSRHVHTHARHEAHGITRKFYIWHDTYTSLVTGASNRAGAQLELLESRQHAHAPSRVVFYILAGTVACLSAFPCPHVIAAPQKSWGLRDPSKGTHGCMHVCTHVFVCMCAYRLIAGMYLRATMDSTERQTHRQTDKQTDRQTSVPGLVDAGVQTAEVFLPAGWLFSLHVKSQKDAKCASPDGITHATVS
jgi:hypothetical protein